MHGRPRTGAGGRPPGRGMGPRVRRQRVCVARGSVRGRMGAVIHAVPARGRTRDGRRRKCARAGGRHSRGDRNPGIVFGDAKDEDKHAHENERPPDPHQPAGIIPHRTLCHFRARAEILYAVPPTGRRFEPTRRSGPRAVNRAHSHARSFARPLHATACVCDHSRSVAGWSRLAARRAHNPKVGGSNPPPATKSGPAFPLRGCRPLHFRPDSRPSGAQADGRSSARRSERGPPRLYCRWPQRGPVIAPSRLLPELPAPRNTVSCGSRTLGTEGQGQVFLSHNQ